MMKKYAPSGPKQQLHKERLQHHWTQQELAERVGTSVVTVNRWERGVTDPSPYFRLKLCALFGKNATELGLLPDEIPSPALTSPNHATSASEPPEVPSAPITSPLKYLPFRRNPLFTGRDVVLTQIHTLFFDKQTPILALCGLGGIGKTQTAREYAYRFCHEYQTILWFNAENADVLLADCRNLLRRLHLLPSDDQQQAFELFQVWLSNQQRWLLLLDNVEQSALIEQLLPPIASGHVLLTTRTKAPGPLAQRVDLPQMPLDESILFLLRRAKLLSLNAHSRNPRQDIVDTACELCQSLAGLPLALDQAGAYIEETGCSLPDYQERYRHYRKMLLARRGENALEHPASVVATIALCMERIEQRHPAAAELLRFCAFLHPDGIDENLLRIGAPALGSVLAEVVTSPIALDAALASLRTLSLLERDTTTRRLLVHRVVQAVLKDAMTEEQQCLWATRVVHAINLTMPEGVSLDELQTSERYLLHVSLCAEYISHWTLTFSASGQLLFKTGHYLLLRGHIALAETFLADALVIQEHIKASDLALASTLYVLANVYEAQGEYSKAEAAYRQALLLRNKTLSPRHPDVTATLECIGRLAIVLGQYATAQPLLERVLRFKQERLGTAHVSLISVLHLLSFLHQQLGDYATSEHNLQQALIISQQTLGATHPQTIETLSRLITLYHIQGNEKQAEALYHHTLTLFEQAGDAVFQQTVPSFRSLGAIYALQGNYRQAEVLLRQAIAICRRTFGNTHPETAESLRVLADIYHRQGNVAQAEALLHQVLTIQEQILHPSHLDIASTLYSLALLLAEQGQHKQATLYAQRTYSIRHSILTDEHPDKQASSHLIDELQASETS